MRLATLLRVAAVVVLVAFLAVPQRFAPLFAPFTEYGAPPIYDQGSLLALALAHLGIVFLANLELGYITPPVGLNLFMSSYRFEQPILQVLRAVLPIIVVQSVVVLLITYIPVLTTALPEWLAK